MLAISLYRGDALLGTGKLLEDGKDRCCVRGQLEHDIHLEIEID